MSPEEHLKLDRLNREVAEMVMGIKQTPLERFKNCYGSIQRYADGVAILGELINDNDGNSYFSWCRAFNPSEDISDAILVLDKILEIDKMTVQMGINIDKSCHCYFVIDGERSDLDGLIDCQESLPIAICKAALKVMENLK